MWQLMRFYSVSQRTIIVTLGINKSDQDQWKYLSKFEHDLPLNYLSTDLMYIKALLHLYYIPIISIKLTCLKCSCVFRKLTLTSL